MNSQFAKLALVPMMVVFAACGTTEKKEDTAMTTKVQEQAPADTPEQILARAAQTFSNIEGLAPEKKEKLREIYTRVYSESMDIRRELGQSKSLLFTTLAKTDYKTSEITKLKKKIVSLDQKRLNLMFKALEDVQGVVGKGAGSEEIYKHLEKHELPHRMMTNQQ